MFASMRAAVLPSMRLRFGVVGGIIWFYTGECSGVVASERGSGTTILFSFERGLNLRADRLFAKHWRPSGICLAFGPSLCDKRLIGESSNLNHNLALKRAAIGQLVQ
jgi:hypothetical protein